MNNVDCLIKKVCSNSVKYMNLKDLCLDNFWVMPSTPVYQSEGIPYITSKNIRNGMVMFDDVKYITESDFKNISSNRPIKENDVLISMIGTIGEVGIVNATDLPFYGQNMYLLRLNTELIDIRFFYHYFTSNKVRKELIGNKNNSNQGYLKTKNIESLVIPIPSLENQKEIADMLDNYAKCEFELENSINLEIDNRRKQFEYYRNKLFSFENDAENVIVAPILNFADSYTGLTYKPDNKTNDNTGTIVLRSSNIQNDTLDFTDSVRVNMVNIPERTLVKRYDTLVCVRNGSKSLVGKSAFIPELSEPMAFGAFMSVLRSKDLEKLNEKYLFYVWQYAYDKIRNNNDDAMVINQITQKDFGKILVPIPNDLNKQLTIVNIMDDLVINFKEITNDLLEEIKLRKQQYEYYKDKLLSFKELSVSE